jgi:hypothetical protein
MQTPSRAWLKGIFAALLSFGVVGVAVTLSIFSPRPNYWYREALDYDSLKNYLKARECYQKAVDEGCVPAMHNLALLYENGQGGPQDYTKAAELHQIAATTRVLVSGLLEIGGSNKIKAPDPLYFRLRNRLHWPLWIVIFAFFNPVGYVL